MCKLCICSATSCYAACLLGSLIYAKVILRRECITQRVLHEALGMSFECSSMHLIWQTILPSRQR
jgi:hypothetical protein